MSTLHIALGVVLFAVATAILYVWGLRKSVTQPADLERALLHKCAGRVVKYLKKHASITADEIAKLIGNVTAGQFWSRRRVRVGDAKKFTGEVTRYLLEQQYIVSSGRRKYVPKK